MENEKNLETASDEQNVSVEPEASVEAETVAEETAAPGETVSQEAPAGETPAEETPAEETPAEEAPAEEPVSAEESKPEEKKATPGKLALVIGAIVVVIAVIVALLMGGREIPPAAETVPAQTETTEPAPTIPADGNPDDETCKGTYTVTDGEAAANADTVVATVGDHTLTNSQLQAFYWMQVQSFLSSEYGSYMMYYGVLDYTQPLDTQVCAMTGSGTWQQFFLKEALNTWQNYCALSDSAKNTGLTLSAEEQQFMETIEQTLADNAAYYGLETVEELLKRNIGPGTDMADYRYFQELLLWGNKFYDAETAKLVPTQADLEAFYTAHEADYTQSGITKDGVFVDVRHVLFTPQGGTTDETTGQTTYSEEEWAACEAEAQNVLNAWTKGECDEESFAAMANAYSQDPGSNTNGGLYENVQQGQMVAEFDAWCFDEKREPGHYGIVKTTYGYHLMYFVESTPIWSYYAEQDFISEKSNEMMQQLTEQYPLDVDYSAITLGLVNLAG